MNERERQREKQIRDSYVTAHFDNDAVSGEPIQIYLASWEWE